MFRFEAASKRGDGEVGDKRERAARARQLAIPVRVGAGIRRRLGEDAARGVVEQRAGDIDRVVRRTQSRALQGGRERAGVLLKETIEGPAALPVEHAA